ncbi:MFS transporter [Candidatus Formimonas warabiya]|uniref:Putative proline/betaine transporter n=1 Tax=Formimonas warabiya TaxID=1761012 RepID=A0A3G1KVY5_FORW1|nr:MFS transporter [Candidatus Formimonas warabiya]ATW26612.1 hypothetical protein DCMF_19305 [Candidatus Formimonas warabiya]
MGANPVVNPHKNTRFAVVVTSGLVGNIMEWFDYSLYAYFAATISANFFPTEDPLVGLILSFLVFGLGFLARPFGGLVFGHFADKIGRKNTLSATVILMGVSTFAMGILPTYAQVGIAAPILLSLVRMLQGISCGGEWGSAVSFLGEYAKPTNRAFIVSFAQVGIALGLLLGALFGFFLSSVMPKEALDSWGWRIAFLCGIIVALFGYFLRRNVDETPAFKENLQKETITSSPLKEVFRNHKKPMITIFLLCMGGMVTYWLLFTYMATFISKFLKLPVTTGFSLTVVTLIAYSIGLLIFGYLSDRIGRKPFMVAGTAGIVFLGYPLFKILANTTTYWQMALIVSLLAFMFSSFQAANTVAMSELFPTKVRVSGFSVPYQLGAAISGGTAMAVATWLVKVTGNVMSVPVYMCSMLAITFLTVVFLYEETRDKPYEE